MNTTGAGDAFNGRLLHELSQGSDCAAAVGAAVATATRVARQGRGVEGAWNEPAVRSRG
jgi:sugar/nucleoside kinase (ribokinase family)